MGSSVWTLMKISATTSRATSATRSVPLACGILESQTWSVKAWHACSTRGESVATYTRSTRLARAARSYTH